MTKAKKKDIFERLYSLLWSAAGPFITILMISFPNLCLLQSIYPLLSRSLFCCLHVILQLMINVLFASILQKTLNQK